MFENKPEVFQASEKWWIIKAVTTGDKKAMLQVNIDFEYSTEIVKIIFRDGYDYRVKTQAEIDEAIRWKKVSNPPEDELQRYADSLILEEDNPYKEEFAALLAIWDVIAKRVM